MSNYQITPAFSTPILSISLGQIDVMTLAWIKNLTYPKQGVACTGDDDHLPLNERGFDIINAPQLTTLRKQLKAAVDYYPQIVIPQKSIDEVKYGLRPLSPDGLPFIGRHHKISNLVLATGHSMMGWSLGPATGKLVTELISNQSSSLCLVPFSPERTFGRKLFKI